MSASEILEQIRNLPSAEKLELIEQIRNEFADGFESIDDALTPEQAAELDRRVAELDANPENGVPWEEVKADIEKRFGWKRP